ncbi:MAG: leucyl/phenylalanyl-tRNA--protein transferase [Candidatus Lambdaproteobacteria bacterium RIFOXYD12_FULL_49_8]|uniref:Leucyl/phenylalanyl-tRNA--protein transferase n=1 Tax=Candidatus Lambdaproteobacteria bacterium RIFOXYD2_FULL_50_16 TaxID=1817772 RepID=A0A1F6GBM8_9PROT|nr:MAG: leucyl/phenylalanyl-tRNA--protein transferase [Candidatus Lambdaproteobacteria bacterium RIFOXYD2_FULL_50_16]OGG97542.1 MAG: leucyl/phenylalanyl-tRNA--protein transferase [Candidatus Lambdaproteobacteria bacterium RIFOXYD12_FULL_49_8]
MPIYRLPPQLVFPDPSEAEPEGILAVGGDLSEERLLLAYSQGIFPWYNEDSPICWWSPDPRLILTPAEVYVSKSLERRLRSARYQITFDQAFGQVITHCAQKKRPGQNGTWILDEMSEAYQGLHQAGYAHSVEVWEAGELIGGLYGVSLGKAFFGESMFSLKPDSSKMALVTLSRHLQTWGYQFIDCQVPTPHLISMGAKEVARVEFLAQLEEALKFPTQLGSWQFDLS